MSANPLLIPEAFDTIVIAGEYMPGLASVGKPKRVFKWDKKEGPGTQGDTLTYRGSRLVDFVIDLTFWESEQIDEWDTKAPALAPDPKAIKALDVIHPVLERLGVRSIVISEIVELFHKGKGEFGVQIGVNEYKAPPKVNATATPAGSTDQPRTRAVYGDGQGAPGDTSTAADAQEKQLAALLALAQKP